MGSSGTPATHIGCLWQKRVLATICAVTVLGVVSVEAQSPQVTRTENHQSTQPIEDFNPCNLQPVNGEGKKHTQTTTKAGPMMEMTIKTHQLGHAFGVDETGEPIRYQYQDWFTQTFRSSSPNLSITFVSRKHMVSEGKPQGYLEDSYFVWEETTFSPMSDPPFSVEEKRRDCK